jgi:hypothetical protein
MNGIGHVITQKLGCDRENGEDFRFRANRSGRVEIGAAGSGRRRRLADKPYLCIDRYIKHSCQVVNAT